MSFRLTKIICLLLVLSSCKSLQHVTSADHSQSSTTASKKRNNVQFIDGVSITPGEQKNSKNSYKTVEQSSKKSLHISSNFNLEKADCLQVKYAIMMNVDVEALNDLPLLQQIDHWWGTRYCLGGNDESCIDCSAFTQTMLRKVYGIDVPRTANEQYDVSTHIKDEDLQEGDLVFFKSGRNISHVGLYIGNNKFVHASVSSGVMISDLNDNYWSNKYAGAGRVQSIATSSASK